MATPERFDPEPFLASLPSKPGVYRMRAADGAVLYVGKARDLKARVTSYFRAAGLTAKTMALIARVHAIDVTVTRSETEALLLEQSLVKAERPPYNVVLRDDKSYPYIHLTDHAFPRLAFHRGARDKAGRYFGPFPSAYAVRDSLNLLQRLFRIRSCEDSFFRNRSRPCLQHQIRRCSAPCVGLVAADQYAEDVGLAVMFLEGASAAVLREVGRKMAAAAAGLEFERAARYRDQIKHLQRVQESQYVDGAGGDVDAFGVATAAGHACVQGLFVRDGRMLGQRAWFPKNALEAPAPELLAAFLSQYYLGSAKRELPRRVVAAVPAAERALLAEALGELAGRRVAVSGGAKGRVARWREMATENAELALSSYTASKRNVFARFVALQEALGLPDVPRRIECFDVSHTGGAETVASCVVFDVNGPLKSDYRRFNVEGVAAGDDFAAMEQTLKRRYRRLREGETPFPDVLVVDGGRGQLARATAVLTELGVEGACLVGIAKGPARKPGLEKVLLAGHGEVALAPGGGALHLLQQVRDEAHRFAITGHRGRRGKRPRQSELDGIAGVGPKRKRELLAHFGSVASIKGASAEEIAKAPGVSRTLAQAVYGALHPG